MDGPCSLVIGKPKTTFPRLPCNQGSGVVIQAIPVKNASRSLEGPGSYFASWKLLGGGAPLSMLTDGFLLGIVPGTLPWGGLSSSYCDFVKYKTLCCGDTELAGVSSEDSMKTHF